MILLPLLLAALVPFQAGRSDDVAPDWREVETSDLVARFLREQDDVDPELVRALGERDSREARDGLIEGYDRLGSIYMRRAVLRALSSYDGVADLQHQALQKLMDVATGSPDRELREAAVDLLGTCHSRGKQYLRMIVDSRADDEVRIRAMEIHAGRPDEEDHGWYRSIWRPPPLPEPPRGKAARKQFEEELAQRPKRLHELRALAFEAIVGTLTLEEVVGSLGDPSRAIRVRALGELDQRGDPRAVEVAEGLYRNLGAPPRDRLMAAEILLRHFGPEITEDLVKDAQRGNATPEFALGLANLLAELDDPKTNKLLLKVAGKGRGLEKLFSLRAARHLNDEKFDEVVLKLIRDKDELVAREAMDIAAERRNRDALEPLMKVVERSKDEELVSDALDAITAIRLGEGEWELELREYARADAPSVRNGALEALGRTGDVAHMEVLAAALDHELWSTRLAAAHAIERLRVVQGVPLLIERLSHESGRMREELAAVLWRLTGQRWGTTADRWALWWRDHGEGFELIGERELERLEQAEELRLERLTTQTGFFGIRIVSDHLAFVLDVSGSMAEPTFSRYADIQGEPRLDLALRELGKALDSMLPTSWFNLISFAGEVRPWQQRLVPWTEENLADARAYMSDFNAGGGTNLYGALRHAFEDPDVDTIYVLSDGEPTMGDVIDPTAIRDAVAEWREHRLVTIHCVAVGGGLRVLEWLAEDTGGTYVRFD